MASSPMKKSRSSIPLFEAKFPGLEGIGGPARVEVACSLVAIAVGKTLQEPSQYDAQYTQCDRRTKMDQSCLQS